MSRGSRGGNRSADKSEDDPNRLWCICKTAYVPGQFMIQCDACDEWYHGSCVNITPDMAETMDTWICDNCSGQSRANKRAAGQFLSDNQQQPAQPKAPKDIRAEVVKHLEKLLRRSLKSCQDVIDGQISSSTAPATEEQPDHPKLSEAEIEDLKAQAQTLLAINDDANKLHQMAVDIEKALHEVRGSEKDKPYREQYRGLRGRFEAADEHQFRMDVFTGKITPAQLGGIDVSAFFTASHSNTAAAK